MSLTVPPRPTPDRTDTKSRGERTGSAARSLTRRLLGAFRPDHIEGVRPPLAGRTEGNRLGLHLDAQGFRKILSVIDGAKDRLSLEMFIFKNDATGRAVADRLIEKARQGVEVRVLVDMLGTLGSGDVLDRMRRGGVQVERYYPGLLPLAGVNLTHRKIVVADGRVGLTGGMNIADEYAHTWHDLMVSVEGPAVADLEQTFRKAWTKAGGKAFTLPESRAAAHPEGSAVTLMTTAPGHSRRGASLRKGIYTAIRQASKEIWLTYPYLSDNRLVDHLRDAARRGVAVHVLLPRPETNDSFLFKLLNEASARQLAQAGVDVRYLESNRFSHVKALSIDGTWSSVGSANGDARSYDANQELNLGIEDPRFARQLETSLFRRWWQRSEPYDTEYRMASWYEKPLLWGRAAVSHVLEWFDFLA
ncbi:MAG: phosphatidylserine/phosphatidylglycerophosphate/cardiolipin synthase family protein [Candidatus Sericytochromatia bacterium]|nr:phosphatidylserine/phosphatidylglycerophosphate/cardiolipin synthase family protein [Candidatus Sericytochromatia bacterium]